MSYRGGGGRLSLARRPCRRRRRRRRCDGEHWHAGRILTYVQPAAAAAVPEFRRVVRATAAARYREYGMREASDAHMRHVVKVTAAAVRETINYIV